MQEHHQQAEAEGSSTAGCSSSLANVEPPKICGVFCYGKPRKPPILEALWPRKPGISGGILEARNGLGLVKSALGYSFSVTKIQHGLVQKFGENYMENPPSYPVVSPKNVSRKKKMTMFIIHRIFRQRDMKKCRRKVRPFFGSLRELLFWADVQQHLSSVPSGCKLALSQNAGSTLC